MARLQGFTNRVYAVDTPAGPFCLRIPGAGTAAIIDRGREAANARSAALAGVSPEVLYFDAAGIMVTPLLSATPLSGTVFKAEVASIARAAAALRRLHDRADDFVGRFDAFATIDGYAALLLERAGTVHPGLAEAAEELRSIEAALNANPPPPRPCHCDATGANMLDDCERVWLIDWEYSGMSDPMWDLAYLSLQAAFDQPLDDHLLNSYLGRPASPGESARMAVQKAPCELLSAAWGLVQVSAGNQVADFATYAGATLRTGLERIRSGPFQHSLDTLRRAET